ncbi:MAG: ferritin family protein [Thermodesulfobacteriota bacterium]
MITNDTTPVEALRLAIENEKRSHRFYLKASKVVKDHGAKVMFEALAKEELEHIKRLEDLYDKEYLQEN